MNISIKIDHELEKIVRSLGEGEKAINKALRSALRGTLKNVRTQSVRIARQRYTHVDIRRLAIAEKINFAEGFYEASLFFSGRRGMGLRHFRPSPGKNPNWRGVDPRKRKPLAGVSSIIIKGRGRKIYTGPNGEKPFWAKAKQGFMALFYREQQSGKNDGVRRLHMLYGPSPIQALGKVSQKQIEKIAQEALSKNVDRALRAAMKGYLK